MIAITRGVAQKKVSLARFRSAVRIPAPELREQQRIVEILEDHLSCLDAASKSLDFAATRTRSLESAALRGILRAAGGEPSVLGDVASWGSGGTPLARSARFYEGGTIPWVNSGDLGDSLLGEVPRKITKAGYAESSAKWVAPGAVLIAMYGATIGRLAITAEPVTTNQAIAHALARPDLIEPEFLFWYLLSQRQGLVAAGKGGAQPNISQTILKTWPITVPPLPAQRKVNAHARELHDYNERLRLALHSANSRSHTLRRALLSAAFSGQLTGRRTDTEIMEELAGA